MNEESLEKINEDWGKLTIEEKEFTLRVEMSEGSKYGALTFYGGKNEDIPLWDNPEKLGFIKCQGTYSWDITSKYYNLKEARLLV